MSLRDSLRALIKEVMHESRGPMIRLDNPLERTEDTLKYREEETDSSNDEIASHLTNPFEDEEDVWGPVPPKNDNPLLVLDPYNVDFHVLPTPPVRV